MTTAGDSRPVRVWGLPTRLVHGLLVAAVIGLLVGGKVGGDALVWHLQFGLVMFSLLGFRLLWGGVGGRWSRFASFLFAAGTVLRYLRGEHLPKGYGQWLRRGLVALHLLAIVVYWLRGQTLVKPMLTGDKPLRPGVPPSTDSAASRAVAALLWLGCGAVAAWIARRVG